MCPVLQRPLAIVKSLYESVCGAVFMLLEKKENDHSMQGQKM